MNGINSIRLDLNAARYQSASANKKIPPVDEVKNFTETEKKKQFNTQEIIEYEPRKEPQRQPVLIISDNDNNYYRAGLLNEIVDKMSGLEQNTSPGQYVEYFV